MPGRSAAVGREADGKGRQTIISVFGSHSRVFFSSSLKCLRFFEASLTANESNGVLRAQRSGVHMGNQEEKHPLLEQDCLPLLRCHPGHISLITSFLADLSEQEAIYLSSWRQRRPSGKEH